MQACSDLLTNDHSGLGLKKLKEEIFEMHYSVKKKMDSGLNSDEMLIAKTIDRAVDSAEQALDNIYSRLNK